MNDVGGMYLKKLLVDTKRWRAAKKVPPTNPIETPIRAAAVNPTMTLRKLIHASRGRIPEIVKLQNDCTRSEGEGTEVEGKMRV